MRKLKISVVSKGDSEYFNKVNGENYKDIALVLVDLDNLGVPMIKAIKEFNRIKKTDWDVLVG